YAVQTYDGLPIANAVSDVHINPRGSVFLAGASFVPTSSIQNLAHRRADVATLTPIEAIEALGRHLGYPAGSTANATIQYPVANNTNILRVFGVSFSTSSVSVQLKYYALDQTLIKVWDINTPMVDPEHWYNAFVSVTDGSVVALTNWVNKATSSVPDAYYDVVPIENHSITEGRVMIMSPWDLNYSPYGWHSNFDDGSPDYSANVTTIGNNAIVQENWAALADPFYNFRPRGLNRTFNFTLDLTVDPTQGGNVNASIAQAFYLVSLLHDIFCRFGFTEAAGNFQFVNFGNQGQPLDPVVVNVQDGSGFNNANFATPPDGQPPLLRAYIFTVTNPRRDGALDNSIMIHEFGHGVSNRLTGGSATANCLTTPMSLGLGEGWSDWLSIALQNNPNTTRNDLFYIGAYPFNRSVRNYPYTTNMSVNPSVYSLLQNTGRINYTEPHSMGEIWTSMLWEVYWNMVDSSGFADPKYLNMTAGNTLAYLMVIDGFKLQPCNPTFVAARNAIIKADQVNTGGKYFCHIWRGFAKRGLGYSQVDITAGSGGYVDYFDLPPSCSGQANHTGALTLGLQTNELASNSSSHGLSSRQSSRDFVALYIAALAAVYLIHARN
ncbi:Fungalysin metallopeptidase-domain-containing protein, partial [Polychytrium aggregatum]|uniref:Fungalysin metallopeptidase-domain-containing protein n=1 Tax=Polychytrium aggregatum TaxID=110093 RepID=UPI0022FDCED6